MIHIGRLNMNLFKILSAHMGKFSFEKMPHLWNLRKEYRKTILENYMLRSEIGTERAILRVIMAELEVARKLAKDLQQERDQAP